ncbi:hypothetical protein [cyanobacterium endosymbiont of Rhopalodia gibberula]|uniref:hypothetical protein n=1 Tax=cyanobacterium endosymbiont of Rhopalodia gibberula TaxID=1763363 RepID=UPI0015592A7E|nr:hypothetical protein [cyanobacterium endosymbiont of Rhopalodia gibberula]
MVCSDRPVNLVNPQNLTHDEIINTGLANKFLKIFKFTRRSILVVVGITYVVEDLCL